jgi:hypothetical protein
MEHAPRFICHVPFADTLTRTTRLCRSRIPDMRSRDMLSRSWQAIDEHIMRSSAFVSEEDDVCFPALSQFHLDTARLLARASFTPLFSGLYPVTCSLGAACASVLHMACCLCLSQQLLQYCYEQRVQCSGFLFALYPRHVTCHFSLVPQLQNVAANLKTGPNVLNIAYQVVHIYIRPPPNPSCPHPNLSIQRLNPKPLIFCCSGCLVAGTWSRMTAARAVKGCATSRSMSSV